MNDLLVYIMKTKLIHAPYSDTIRQMPENYLIAYRKNRRWRCDPDLACNKELATKLFLRLFEYENCYGTAENLISGLNR